MEAGAKRVRRRTKARHDVFNAAWQLTDAQMDTFRTWFEGDCQDGAAWFTISIPDGKLGFATVDARFIDGKYNADVDEGLIWVVSASLEVE
jgi:hypothetical protein